MRNKVSDETFIAVSRDSLTMAQAAAKLKLHWNTFKKRALKLGCFSPNQSGKGMKKPILDDRKIKLSEILEGLHPSYQTFRLKLRLLSEGIKSNKCEVCGCESMWNDKPISMELDHIDGDRTNHKLENLRTICPNCHSQTETYRSRNRRVL
jgi:hypothetical protein